VILAATDGCGPALAGILRGWGYSSESLLRARIKSVLQDKSVLRCEKRCLGPADSSQSCFFGHGSSDGHLGLVRTIGRKGAQLCEMANLGLPVPPGFCFPRNMSTRFLKDALGRLELAAGKTYGDAAHPLLLAVSGSAGEIGNIGLNDISADAMASQESSHFVWDSYRRLISSYASLVHRLDPAPFDSELERVKECLDAKDWLGRKHQDWQIPTRDLQNLVETYKKLYLQLVGEAFPQDPQIQLLEVMQATEATSSEAIIVQSMVFGNYDAQSAVGLLELKNEEAATLPIHGHWLRKAQSEDLNVQRRQKILRKASEEWASLNNISEEDRSIDLPSMEESLGLAVCAGLAHCKDVLAEHMKEAKAVKFVVQQGQLWLLQICDDDQPLVGQCLDHGMELEGVDMQEIDDSFETQEALSEPSKFAAASNPCEESGPCHVVPDLPHLRRLCLEPAMALPRKIHGERRTVATPSSAKAQQPLRVLPGAPALAEKVAENYVKSNASLALPLWQTALAGGTACVLHRTVSSSVEPLLQIARAAGQGNPQSFLHVALRTGPVLAQNLTTCSRGFPFGAICCSLYVNFLHRAPKLGSSVEPMRSRTDSVSPALRLGCAAAAVTLATTFTYPLNNLNAALPCGSNGKSQGLFRGLPGALRTAMPVAAIEMCTIDVVRNMGTSAGYQLSPGLLFLSGGLAGICAQTVLHFRTTQSKKELGMAYLKHAPAVGMNSLVRVGLVTQFMTLRDQCS